MSPVANTFICGTCGSSHEGLPTDCSFELPDDVWAIPKDQRDERAKYTADLCQMGDRWFIRCVLKIPFIEGPGYYGWGIWVEVAKSTFDRYLKLYEVDASSEPRHPGRIANRLDEYSHSLGEPVTMQFGSSNDRPTVHFPTGSHSDLAAEQLRGMSTARYHEILQTTNPD